MRAKFIFLPIYRTTLAALLEIRYQSLTILSIKIGGMKLWIVSCKQITSLNLLAEFALRPVKDLVSSGLMKILYLLRA